MSVQVKLNPAQSTLAGANGVAAGSPFARAKSTYAPMHRAEPAFINLDQVDPQIKDQRKKHSFAYNFAPLLRMFCHVGGFVQHVRTYRRRSIWLILHPWIKVIEFGTKRSRFGAGYIPQSTVSPRSNTPHRAISV